MQGGWYPPPPQPAKQSSGCLLGLLITGGLSLALAVIGVVTYAALAPSHEEAQRRHEAEQKENADLAAAAASAQEEQWRELEADYRARCHIDAGLIFAAPHERIRDTCRDMVRESLVVPGSGDFPSTSDESLTLTTHDGCSRIYESYVDSKNAFGVVVRTRYSCTYDPRTGKFALDMK